LKGPSHRELRTMRLLSPRALSVRALCLQLPLRKRLVQPTDRQLAGVKLTLLRMQDRRPWPMRDSPPTPVARDRGEQKIAATSLAIRRYADQPHRRRGGADGLGETLQTDVNYCVLPRLSGAPRRTARAL